MIHMLLGRKPFIMLSEVKKMKNERGGAGQNPLGKG